MTLSSLITDITSWVTAAIGWIGDVAETVGSTPLLLVFCAIVPLSGIAIGYFRRLIHVN